MNFFIILGQISLICPLIYPSIYPRISRILDFSKIAESIGIIGLHTILSTSPEWCARHNWTFGKLNPRKLFTKSI
ncbi:hypothetical protein [Streptococcus parauberis]|uniref:hypothetical protein n=1 Tax=Streptococcus parauberis TaxID=1348 RepID=UPI0012677D3F|nr:hypothetical protein [Streptococcus parauberis]